MIVRVSLVAVLAAICFSGCAVFQNAHEWNPLAAKAAAERDIASGNIRFCFVGGRAPIAPGIPDGAYALVARYPRIAVGDQGCIQDQGSDIRWEYARRYNVRMWQHVSRMQRRSSNQSLEPTAGRRTARSKYEG
jgi:hypothetical protein